MKKTLFGLCILAVVSCGNDTGQPGVATPPPEGATSGEVVETMDVDSYTYIKLQTGTGETWLATSPVEVEPGDTVTFSGGMLMPDFHSATLDRTFEEILFVGRVEVLGAQGTPGLAEVQPAGGTPDPHAGLATMLDDTGEPVDLGPSVATLTIAELLADSGAWAGKRITVHGRVVKFNEHIMGKNWVTLEDGTGASPDNHLTATTAKSASVGDELALTGTVRTDVDLGFGYVYKVLLEDAAFD